MISKTTIRASNGGWVVYFNDNPRDFYPFLSKEPERFVKFICEKVAGIRVDQLVTARLLEREEAKSHIVDNYVPKDEPLDESSDAVTGAGDQ